MAPFYYRSYERLIRSTVRFPELEPDGASCRVRVDADGTGAGNASTGPDADADVVVRRGDVDVPAGSARSDRPVYESPTGRDRVYREDGALYWRRAGVGRLVARRGDAVVVDPSTGSSDAAVRRFVLGPGFRAVLLQQGHLVLHGSAVAVDGRAVAFVGDSGAGKSTTAAGFAARGHPFLSDDVTPVYDRAGGPVVPPGHPFVKTEPGTVEALRAGVEDAPTPERDAEEAGPRGIDAEVAGSGETDAGRRLVSPPGDLAATPRPLDRVYVVEAGDDPHVESIPPGRRLLDLVVHSFALYRTRHAGAAAAHFDRAAAVAAETAPKRLVRGRTLEDLPAVVRTVEADLEASRG